MKRKLLSALNLAVIFSLLITSLALADVIDGDTVASGTASANLGTVSPGAVLTPQVTFELDCFSNRHVDNGQTVSLAFSLAGSTVPAGGSLSATDTAIGPIPPSWPDDALSGGPNCGSPAPASIQDNGNSTVTITAPVAPGMYTYVVRYTNSLSPAGNLDPSSITAATTDITFTLTVAAPADTTPPVISYTVNGLYPEVPDGLNGWYVSDVFVDWTVTDPESSFSTTGCVDTTINTDTAGTMLSCSATSDGGSAGPVTVTIMRDATAPTISGSASPAPNGNGWNNTDVDVTFTCDDNLSGVASCGPDETLTGDGAGQEVTGTAEDNAGNTATDTVSGIDIDKTAPVITDDGPNAGPDGSGGWYISAVTNQFSADGAISGLADPSQANFTVSTGSAEGSSVTVNSGPVSDNAGNTHPGIDSAAFMIDLSDPSVVCQSPAPSFLLNQAGAQVFASVSDTVSGPASPAASAPADTSTVGSKTVDITGYDNAGRSTTVSCSYNVTYNFAGFFQPVDNLPALNLAKAGQAIPLKWRLTDANGDPVLNLASVTVTVQSLSCTLGTTGDQIEEYAAGASGLQNLGDGYYQFNWKTPTSYANSCKTVRVNLGDGTLHTAQFQFKR
jgi:hypothetical protein